MVDQQDTPDPDFEQWLEALQGDPKTDHPEGLALRAALIQEQVERTRVTPEETETAFARLRERMIQENLLEPTQDHAPSGAEIKPFPTPKDQKTAARWRLPTSWRPITAVAAAVVLAVPILMQFESFGPAVQGPDTQYRGEASTLVINATDPAALTDRLMAELTALGLAPKRQEQGGTIRIQVNVNADRLETFFEWASDHGGRAVKPGDYTIVVQPDAP